jgi:hypothetical protein
MITLVQQATATIAGAVASVAFTLGQAPTPGNFLVCAFEMNDSNPTMSGTGVTWTRQNVFVGDASHDNTALFTGVVGTGASTTQTFTPGASTSNAAGILLEFNGVQQVLDGTPPTPTNLSSATPSITSTVPGVSNDLVVAFMGNVANSAPTATPSGWTTVTAATNTRRLDGAYKLNTDRAAVSATWTYSGSQFALAQILLVKDLSLPHNVRPTGNNLRPHAFSPGLAR